MSTYVRPMLAALRSETDLASCNFHGNSTTSSCNVRQGLVLKNCVTVSPVNPSFEPGAITIKPILTNTIVGVDDNGFRVTPVAGTGLPASDPIFIGIPLGVTGVRADVGATRGSYAIGDSVGVDVLGVQAVVNVPAIIQVPDFVALP